ncbi:MAG: hypothetical protein VXZ59_00095 [Cyanobacteriota bacterium]|nr:hypothetical protein [Cyanobacteriota bacterium]
MTTAPKAHASGLYVTGQGGGAVVRTAPAPRICAPETINVKHNIDEDTIKVCQEYIYGTTKCVNWSH